MTEQLHDDPSPASVSILMIMFPITLLYDKYQQNDLFEEVICPEAGSWTVEQMPTIHQGPLLQTLLARCVKASLSCSLTFTNYTSQKGVEVKSIS